MCKSSPQYNVLVFRLSAIEIAHAYRNLALTYQPYAFVPRVLNVFGVDYRLCACFLAKCMINGRSFKRLNVFQDGCDEESG